MLRVQTTFKICLLVSFFYFAIAQNDPVRENVYYIRGRRPSVAQPTVENTVPSAAAPGIVRNIAPATTTRFKIKIPKHHQNVVQNTAVVPQNMEPTENVVPQRGDEQMIQNDSVLKLFKESVSENAHAPASPTTTTALPSSPSPTLVPQPNIEPSYIPTPTFAHQSEKIAPQKNRSQGRKIKPAASTTQSSVSFSEDFVEIKNPQALRQKYFGVAFQKEELQRKIRPTIQSFSEDVVDVTTPPSLRQKYFDVNVQKEEIQQISKSQFPGIRQNFRRTAVPKEQPEAETENVFDLHVKRIVEPSTKTEEKPDKLDVAVPEDFITEKDEEKTTKPKTASILKDQNQNPRITSPQKVKDTKIEEEKYVTESKPDPKFKFDGAEFRRQAAGAKYQFASEIKDNINGNNHAREEVRDGLAVKGKYSFSDGYFMRTVHYEADDKGYRVVKEEVIPLEGPQYNPDGDARVSQYVGGNTHGYQITADDINKRTQIITLYQQIEK